MYPKLSNVRKLERETLRSITEIGEFGRLEGLQAAAKAARPLISEDRGAIDVHLFFSLDIALRGRLQRRRIDLGALVRVSQDEKQVQSASYSVVIGKDADPTRSPVLRKFHFDYEPIGQRNHAEPKPSVHMQICGKFSRHHLDAGYKEYRLKALYPDFEKPRVPCQPTSLALLLHWLLLEFQFDTASQAVLKNPRWRKLVADAERTVLASYFEGAATFLKSAAHREKTFLQAHIYEMSAQ